MITIQLSTLNFCTLMNLKKYFISPVYSLLVCFIFTTSCNAQQKPNNMSHLKKNNSMCSKTDTSKVILSEEEWKNILPTEVFEIARMKGTERPWSSKYENHHDIGTYYCAACGNALFKSNTKFESGCGWPSFYEPINKAAIIYTPDGSHGMQRTEVQCGRCKSHLGHVFEDGPPPTGLRYCINGVVLDFEKAKATSEQYKANHKVDK